MPFVLLWYSIFFTRSVFWYFLLCSIITSQLCAVSSQSNDNAHDNSKSALKLLQFCLNSCDDNDKQALCKTIIYHASILLKSISLKSRMCRCRAAILLIKYPSYFVLRISESLYVGKRWRFSSESRLFHFSSRFSCCWRYICLPCIFTINRLNVSVLPMHFGTVQRWRNVGAYPLPMTFLLLPSFSWGQRSPALQLWLIR